MLIDAGKARCVSTPLARDGRVEHQLIQPLADILLRLRQWMDQSVQVSSVASIKKLIAFGVNAALAYVAYALIVTKRVSG